MSEANESSEERRGFRVRGRVQGVGFRWWAQRLGERLGLRGHVRNLASGDVEVHAGGSANAIARLMAALREGPPMARVSAVEEIEANSLPASGFHVEFR